MSEDNSSRPNFRKMKKIYVKVRKQMEFYFSDSNLVKDKFLSDLISKDPDGFVEIEIFKSFNKIKALTNSCEVIRSAISRSNMFEISKDNKKVRRITPVELNKDFDACTLYVEKLPPSADQKWVKDVFGQFGTIKYVNVPRFKVTNKIKGFAFVEFENPEGVKHACEFYKDSSEKECSSSEDESKITKNVPKNHKNEENQSDKKNKKSRTRSVSESSDKMSNFSSVKNDQGISDKDIDSDKDPSHLKEKRKRKRDDSFSEATAKKPRESDNENLNNLTTISKEEQSDLKKESDSIQTTDQEDSKHENMEEVSDKPINGTKVEGKKSKRKRKKSKKNHSNTEKPALRVMSKSEWKNYRNKYLELQRKTMSLLKRHVFLETQEAQLKSMEVPEPKKNFQYTPGVILKVELSEPVKNPTEVKNQVKASVVVAYIDAPLESSEIFIRCHTPEEAETIVKEEKLSNLGKTEVIQGDEEKSYWEKIETDRKNKYENPVPHKKRGRDKILAKAAKLAEMKNKHVYFDE